MIKTTIDLLREPLITDLDVDGEERIRLHGEIINRKPMIREVFRETHALMLGIAEQFRSVPGVRIELGAGVAPIRNLAPDVAATDVVAGAHLDRTLDAESMDLPDESVSVFFAQNTFHHFPHPRLFFAEIQRTLAPGGGVILLEPYYGPVASFVFKRLFSTEGFDKHFPEWETPTTGPMNGANQALSYIVFVRDRLRLESEFPELRIEEMRVVPNYLKYLLSGGLNFRQLVPNFMVPVVGGMENLLSPANSVLGLHHIVVLRKAVS